MRTSEITSIAATLLAGAALFASSVKADLDPIVIKVRVAAFAGGNLLASNT